MENNENNEVLNTEEVEQDSNEIETTTNYEELVNSDTECVPETKTTSPALAIGVGVLLVSGIAFGVIKGAKWISKKIKDKKATAKASDIKMSENEIIDVEVDDLDESED